MGNRFAAGKKAFGFCDICGFRVKLAELKDIYRKGNKTGIKACPTCWDGDHPQNFIGEYPVHDPQALRDPRPDNAEAASRTINQFGFDPVGFSGAGFGLLDNVLALELEVGTVTVEIS